MKLDTLDAIHSAGFSGFASVRDLQATGCALVPDVAGIYLVVRESASRPEFTPQSRGGWFKGRDPTQPIPQLETHWVEGAAVLYVGKAGGGRSKNTLRRRLRSYVRFGAGQPVSHWGGRLIWQLDDCDALIICWLPSGTADAAKQERELIQEFSSVYGKRPFANLKD